MGDVEAVLQAGGVDVGEAAPDEGGRPVADVEIDTVVATGLQLAVDGPGHGVAGGQVAALVVFVHEVAALAVDEAAAFAAHRFGDQKIFGLGMKEAGRMELDEFQIGHPGPGPIGHGDAVAGGDIGIGGVEIDLAGPAGTEHRDPGQPGGDPAVRAEHVGPQATVAVRFGRGCGRAGLGGDQEIDGQVVFQDLDALVCGRRLQQSPFDLPAGKIQGMGDAPGRVAALHAEIEAFPMVLVMLEGDAELDQFPDPGRTVLHHHPDHLFVAEPGPGTQGVLNVQREGILRGQHRGDAALGQVGGGVNPGLLGDQGYPAQPRRLQGEGEAGNAAADNQKVGGLGHLVVRLLINGLAGWVLDSLPPVA